MLILSTGTPGLTQIQDAISPKDAIYEFAMCFGRGGGGGGGGPGIEFAGGEAAGESRLHTLWSRLPIATERGQPQIIAQVLWLCKEFMNVLKLVFSSFHF